MVAPITPPPLQPVSEPRRATVVDGRDGSGFTQAINSATDRARRSQQPLRQPANPASQAERPTESFAAPRATVPERAPFVAQRLAQDEAANDNQPAASASEAFRRQATAAYDATRRAVTPPILPEPTVQIMGDFPVSDSGRAFDLVV
ncbi:MAG: hypothetical protein HQL40_07795 [Alphaproteobacteria bacterium]|nr:hypothetical protein [Alphaproteobacteria bacterium]